MKKIIVGLITLCAATFMYGMNEQASTSQRTETSFQKVASCLQNSWGKLIELVDPLQKDERAAEKNRTIQKSIQEKKRAAQVFAAPVNQTIVPQQTYSFSQVFKSAGNVSLVLWNIIRRIVTTPIRIFWGNPPVLNAYPYEHERFSNDLIQEDNVQKARELFMAQAEEEQEARKFQTKHTIALGVLATAICTGIASHKYGFNSKMTLVSLGVSLAATVVSGFVLGNRASINDIKRRGQTRSLQLTGLHVSPQEADEAYTRETGGSLLDGLRSRGFFGLLAVQNMRDTVKRNFSLTTCVKDESAYTNPQIETLFTTNE